jgi:hypothetical protein
MQGGVKIDGFPTTAHFTRLVAEGNTSVKDLRTGKMTCIILLPNGRHCGQHMIFQGGGDAGWDLTATTSTNKGFIDGRVANFGEGHWRCPKKHSSVPEATVGANPKVMSVEERQALDAAARVTLDPIKGTLVEGQSTKAVAVQERAVETIVTKDKISFDVLLDELTSADLLNELLNKISLALDSVPTSNMGEAKKLMKIQEAVEALKK